MTLGTVSPTGCHWADMPLEDSEDEFSDSELHQGKADSSAEGSDNGLTTAMSALAPHSDSSIDFAFLLQAAQLKGGIPKSSTTNQVPQSKKKKNQKKASGALHKKRVRSRAQAKSLDHSNCAYLFLSEKLLKDDASDIASVSTLATYEMPNATDEVWQRRQEVRLKDIELIKATGVYKRFCDTLPETEQPSLACPDPYDRTISKRKWKNAVNTWHYQVFWAAISADRAEKSGRTPNSEQGEPKPK